MPTVKNGDATLYYEEHGKGFPILTFAPAGLRSDIAAWDTAPIHPVKEWSGNYRVIVMDQRNAGRSRAPITAKDGWHTYASDHAAVLDHAGVKRCHLFGQCIGGDFIFAMLKSQSQRIASAVIAQPSGRVGPLKQTRSASFQAWVKTLKDHPEATDQVLDTMYRNMYEPDFVHSVDRAFVASCLTPCLLLAGNDDNHPRAVSDEIAKIMPNVEYITEWKTGPALDTAKVRVKQFLGKHTPAAG
jgi:pimeloyl-ACP methyl ester carboxylesterase